MKSINKLMSVACASALLFSCSGKKEQAATATEELPLVTIEKVTEEDVPQIVSYTATVEPFKTNNISASSANRIKSILVDVGSTVAAGQTVAGIIRSIEQYGIFVELAPNLAGLAELKSSVRVGDCACVYIKAIIPEKMKIKLIIVGSCDDGCVPLETPYFITKGHIDRWVYSTPEAPKYIATNFV